MLGGGRVRGLAARLAEVIRIDGVPLAVEPVDLRAGMDIAELLPHRWHPAITH